MASWGMFRVDAQLSGDKIRVLAVFSDNRLPGALANVPTAKEQGNFPTSLP
jgi:tripartite-type tricarboxylate transporter receptor subunit TctC